MTNFVAVRGKSGGSPSWSFECPLRSIGAFATRDNYDPSAGINYKDQKGVNRAWEKRRSYTIAEGMENTLLAGRKLEHGAFVFFDVNGSVKIVNTINPNLDEIQIADKVIFGDRQHSFGAIEYGLTFPDKFPNLHKYITDDNTGTIRIVKCKDRNEARQRFRLLNLRPKQLTTVEKSLYDVMDALYAEEEGQVQHCETEMPELVSFMAWYEISKEPNNVWCGKLQVDSMSVPPKKQTIGVKLLVDNMWPIYNVAMKLDEKFRTMPMTERASYMKRIILAYWTQVTAQIPDAINEHWYNYLVLKRGAKLLIKIHAALVSYYMTEVTKDARGRKPAIEAPFGEMEFEEFCLTGINEFFLKGTAPDSPYRDSDWWKCTNGNEKSSGLMATTEQGGLEYLWKRLNHYGVSKQKWAEFLGAATSNPAGNRKGEYKKPKPKIPDLSGV